jgi:anthranilate 1,2-dioxygenase small subunit
MAGNTRESAFESAFESTMALFSDYASALDERRFDDWTELFCEQCHYQVQSKENWDLGLPAALIYCDSRAMIQDRVTVLKDTLTYPYVHSRHLITNIRIHGEAGGGV